MSKLRSNERALMSALAETDNYSDTFEPENFEDSFENDLEDFESDNFRRARRPGLRGGRKLQISKPRGVAGIVRAQFDLNIKVFYTQFSGPSTFTVLAPSALPSVLKVNQAAYIFGSSDYYSGFAIGKAQDNISGWVDGGYVIAGNEYASFNAGSLPGGLPGHYDLVKTNFKNGDLIIIRYSVANNVAAFTQISCRQTAYTSLLESIASDVFRISLIRYTVADETKINQFDNNINFFRQSLFGRLTNDFVSPLSFKDPQQYQKGVIDVKVNKGIDKETLMVLPINFDATDINWSIFVDMINKRTF